ncbi:MAG: flavodoxin family protein [Methanobacterium sp.]|nr:flavodoxin family protein [Methanobacterium sp.]
MKVLITYNSVHQGNTEKIAKTMASAIDADIMKYNELDGYNILDYDLIGFGSGIYYGKPNKELLEFIDELPPVKGRKAFIFTTSGKGNLNYTNALAKKVSLHGFKIVGEFSCKGFDVWGPLRLIGGINNGRPNTDDLNAAEIFVKELLKQK